VENFQNSHKVANEHKLTSEEANFQRIFKIKLVAITKAVSRKTSFCQNKRFRSIIWAWRSIPTIHLLPVSSSARPEVNKGHDTPHIGDISYMLHAAGHQKTISLRR